MKFLPLASLQKQHCLRFPYSLSLNSRLFLHCQTCLNLSFRLPHVAKPELPPLPKLPELPPLPPSPRSAKTNIAYNPIPKPSKGHTRFFFTLPHSTSSPWVSMLGIQNHILLNLVYEDPIWVFCAALVLVLPAVCFLCVWKFHVFSCNCGRFYIGDV